MKRMVVAGWIGVGVVFPFLGLDAYASTNGVSSLDVALSDAGQLTGVASVIQIEYCPERDLLCLMNESDVRIARGATGEIVETHTATETFTDMDLTSDGRYLFVADYDGDGDGQNNRDEYVSGMDPTDPDSAFMVRAFESPTNGAFVLGWDSLTGRVYSIHWKTNLPASFQSLETNIRHPQNSYTDSVHNAEGQGFCCIGVELEN